MLIPEKEVKDLVINKIIIPAKTKLLGFKSKVAPILKDNLDSDTFTSVLDMIDLQVKELLEDLGSHES